MLCNTCGTRETKGTRRQCWECNPNQHGVHAKYLAGCRCPDCKQSSITYSRRRASGQTGTNAHHGTPTRYRTGCRCDRCTAASRRHRTLQPHNMSPTEHRAILDIQGGVCALCLTAPGPDIETFHIDHGHNCTHRGRKISCENCWRGILCQVCNPHLERKVGHAYLREVEGVKPTPEDLRILAYIRNPPAQIYLKSQQEH